MRRRLLMLIYHVLNAASIIGWLISLGLGALVTAILGWAASFDSLWQVPLWVGVFLVTTGIALSLVSRLLPPPTQPIASSLAHPEWTSPEELRDYLQSIKSVMEEEGFGSEPPAPTPTPEPSGHAPSSTHEERDALIKRGHDLLANMAVSSSPMGGGRILSARAMGYPATIAFVRDGQELVSRVLPARANPALITGYKTIEEARFAIQETLSALGNIGHKVTPFGE